MHSFQVLSWVIESGQVKWVAVQHTLDVDELQGPVRRQQVAVLHSVDGQRPRFRRKGDGDDLDGLRSLPDLLTDIHATFNVIFT